jgi:hypothetical protein
MNADNDEVAESRLFMTIGSIGSTPSFWQQDQNYWSEAQENDNSTAATTSVISAISSAETSLGKGLASIANQAALNRTNTELSAAIQNVLKSGGTSDTSSSSSSTASSSGSSGSSANTSAAPATGTGTVPLTESTSLSTLRILPGGTITVGTGSNITTYTSTGVDTVADLMNTINVDLPTNANVTASLNAKGQLVITSRDDKSSIFVGGSGDDAAAIGFGVGNDTFLPTAASPSSTSSSSTASSSSSAASSTATATSSTTASKSYTTVASEVLSSAASLLSDSGDGGTLVDMLA